MASTREKLYLIDGSSYIFRAYYAIRTLSNSKGLPTNALYGFTRMILKFIKDEKPDKLAIVFDTKEPTFRDEMYEKYKANRKEPPDDLVPQFEYFGPIVDALNIKQMSKIGFEADDIIGTVAKKAEKDGYEVIIITGDKDFMQLVSDHVKLYDTMKEKWIGEDEVEKKFGVKPESVIDVMSLAGDSSDNIPGVRGIGDKTAKSLIREYGSLENLISNIKKLSNLRMKVALRNGLEEARLSKKLATIKLDVPIEFNWKDFDLSKPNASRMKEVFGQLEFFKLLREILPEEELKEPSGTFRIISSISEFDEMKKDLKSSGAIALHFFSGFAKKGGKSLGVAICPEGSDALYVPMDFINADFYKLFKGKKLYLYDVKKQLKTIENPGFSPEDKLYDVRLMSYVLNSAGPQDLVTMAQQVLGVYIAGEGQKVKGQGDLFETVSVEDIAKEALRYADVVLKLGEKFSEDLKENKSLEKLFYDIEMPLVWVLMKMEKRGVKVDVGLLNSLSDEYDGEIKRLESMIYKEAGEKFAISSPKQLSKILFEKLKLPIIKKTKTGYSTDSNVLNELANQYEIAKLVLEYRSRAKLKSTYIDVLPTLVNSTTGRIHTTFNQAITATGRLSSSDPNLQNVPARSREGLRIRKAFVADDGSKLISADYSQIELRILAHISEERALIEAFEKGVDVHKATAAYIFGVNESKVDKEMRAVAKTVNFGVLYGQSAYGLSKQLDIEVGEADQYIKNYYSKYPKVAELKEKIIKDAAKKGYVETLFGRRRYIPDINSSNQSVKAFAERTAFNAVFQGTAADIIKKAMLEVDEVLKGNFPDFSMLLQVHDELVFESPASKVNQLVAIVSDKMCNVVKLKIPLEVDIGIGLNWAECK